VRLTSLPSFLLAPLSIAVAMIAELRVNVVVFKVRQFTVQWRNSSRFWPAALSAR
jgi:hypothetical protein